MTGPADDSGRASLRDVYKAQQETREELAEVRKDLGGKIDNLSDQVNVLAVAHEHRITTVETVQADQTIQLTDHSNRISALEKAHDRALGHIGAVKILGGVIGGAATIVVGDVVIKALGG